MWYEGNSGERDDVIDDLPVIRFITSRGGGKSKKATVPKCPTTRLQSKAELDSALKMSKEKKKRMRLVKNRLIDEKDVHPADVV